MAINNTSPRTQLVGNGVQTAFTYPFKVFEEIDIEAYIGATLKTLFTDYTVSGVGNDNGGSVTFVTAPANGAIITLVRRVARERDTDYQPNSELDTDAFNREYDRIWAINQEITEQESRTIRLRIEDVGAELRLPLAAARASKALIFDASGDLAVSTDDYEDQLADVTAQATAAATSASNASTSATNASNSATAAATSATNSANSATAAAGSATTAGTHATNASTSASNASTSASAASTSATNAATSESNAATSASTATTQASAAATSASTATTQAGAASTSATNASNSATAAAGSATTAGTHATNASTSATNASNSATAAATSESNAGTSASTATTQASNASTSASTAGTHATNASNSATAAAGSATTAGTHATNAGNSATAAAGSATTAGTHATNAGNSATAAATSASNAAASYDSFDDRYLGAKSSDPSTDNDGNTLIVGALYFNTSSGDMKVWSGSAWLVAYASGSGYMLAANNLSELTNTTSARSNLGLGSIATQAASSVTISGGSIAGITDLAITDGGTGASDAATARANLGALAASSYTASDVLSKLLTVDGAGTGLDADKLDGQEGSYYAQASRSILAGAGLTGGGDISADRTISLATIISAGSVGSSSAIPVLTYDAYGRIAAASTASIDGPGLVLLQTASGSGAASLDLTSISSTYDDYVIEYCIDQSADAYLDLLYSTDGGSSWITSTDAYNYSYMYGNPGADGGSFNDASTYNNLSTVSGNGNSGTQKLRLVGYAGVGGADGDQSWSTTAGEVKLFNLNSTTKYKRALFNGAYTPSNVSNMVTAGVHGGHCGFITTSAINAIRFVVSTGNIASGSYARLYGYKK